MRQPSTSWFQNSSTPKNPCKQHANSTRNHDKKNKNFDISVQFPKHRISIYIKVSNFGIWVTPKLTNHTPISIKNPQLTEWKRAKQIKVIRNWDLQQLFFKKWLGFFYEFSTENPIGGPANWWEILEREREWTRYGSERKWVGSDKTIPPILVCGSTTLEIIY